MVGKRLRHEIGTRRLAWRQRRWRRLYSRFVRPGALCFDVGANRGDRTALFLALGARVVAVEPQRLCQERLRFTFGADPRVVIVPLALGPEPGIAEIFQPAPESGLASMSPAWIESVRASGRFGESSWDRVEGVAVTTLDALVAEHGVPDFCKIDVEGYEPEVLKGLSRPLPAVSVEFTPEHRNAAVACVEHLTALGKYEFNYSLGEAPTLRARRWLAPGQLLAALERFGPESRVFGDVYARLRA